MLPLLAIVFYSAAFLLTVKLLAAHVPTVEITEPAPGEVVSGVIPVSVNYGVDRGNVHTLILLAGSPLAEVERVAVHDQEGSHTFFLDTTNYPDGPLQIKVEACSSSPHQGDHCSDDSVSVVADNIEDDTEAPEIEITSPGAGELVSAAPVVVSAALSDNVAVSPESVIVKLDTQTVTPQCDVTAVSVICALSPSDGRHNITIDCRDTSGNPATQAGVSFTLDTIAPVVSVTSHTDGQTVTAPTADLAGTASDATSGVVSVEINGEAAVLNGNSWSLENFALDEGANVITITAGDAAGHSKVITITINYNPPDTQKPVITIGEPATGALLDAPPVIISAELEDNVAVATASVVVKLDGENITGDCAVTSFSVDCAPSPEDGAHTATINCKDINNNTAVQKSVTFTVDTTTPTAAVTSHSDGQIVVTPAINLSGTASDATSGVVSVKANGEDASLNGNAWSLAGFSLEEGPNAVVIEAEDAAGHAALVAITINYVVPECFNDAGCDDSDAYTEDVCTAPGTADAACSHNHIECQSSADCDDSDAYTADACTAAGTIRSACVHSPIACLSNEDCDDSQQLTLDTCNSPGTAGSSCSHDPLECASDTDCEDENALTIDDCLNPGTMQSECSHVVIACNTNDDCSDGNNYTEDVCVSGGTPGASCNHNIIECLSAADCDDGRALTLDACSGAGTPLSACVNTPIACNTDTDCDDRNAYTLDTCAGGGTIAASCAHAAIRCLTYADCDDSDPLTTDSCVNPGAASSSCSNVKCPVACASAADCDDGNPLTNDVCSNPGDCAAACSHVACAVACTSAAECDDGNPATTDTCAAPGTCGAACSHTPISEPAALTLAITSPSEGLITNNPSITIAGTTTPGATVTINGSPAAVGADGAFSDGVAINKGINTINTVASLGMQRIEKTITVTLDTKAPTVISSDPTDGAEIEIAPSRVAVRIEDNPGGSGLNTTAIRLFLDGEEIAGQYVTTTQSIEAAGIEIQSGRHILHVSASDLAGNTLDQTITFVLAGKGPKVKFLKLPGTSGASASSVVGTSSTDTGGSSFTDSTFAQSISSTPAMESGAVTTTSPSVAGGTSGAATAQSASSGWLDVGQKYNIDTIIELLKEKYPSSDWNLDGRSSPTGAAGGPRDAENAASPIADAKITVSSYPPPTAFSVVGELEAQIDEGDAPVDADSIHVEVDGIAVPHEYAPASNKVKSKVKGLKKGAHNTKVTASDTDGATGMAMSAFTVSAIADTLTFENLTMPGTEIRAGDRFRLRVDSTYQYTPWVVLYNPVIPVSPGTVGSCNAQFFVGDGYSPALIGGTAYSYEGEGIFYTSADREGRAASRVYAATPVDAFDELGNGNCLFSSNSMTVVNGPVAPHLDSATFKKATDPAAKVISLGDEYTITASGSPGVVNADYWLIDPEQIEGSGVLGAAVDSGVMVETALGSGQYALMVPRTLNNVTPPGKSPARFLLALVRPRAWNADIPPAVSDILYIGPAPAPVFNVVEVSNSDHPGEPLRHGQRYRIRIQGDVDYAHRDHLKVVLINSDRFYPGWKPYYGTGLFIPGTESGYNTGLNWMDPNIYGPGVYEAEGFMPPLSDSDGQTVSNVRAVVTAASYFDYAVSSPVPAEQAQPPVSVENIRFINKDHPDWTTVAASETVRVEAEAAPGLSLDCLVSAASFTGGENTEPVVSKAMTEGPSGKYSCEGAVATRPDVNGAPADFLMAKTISSGSFADMADDLLTFRDAVREVHFRNLTRPGAADIAPGERFEITAAGQSGLSDIYGSILDAALFHSAQQGPFQPTDRLIEDTPGNYRIEAALATVPYGVKAVRAAIGDPNSPVKPVVSTEILAVVHAEPPKPPEITHVNNVLVSGGEVTSDSFSPVVTGTAEPDSTVKIYEFTEGAGVEIYPVPNGLSLSASFIPGSFLYDDFGDSTYSENLWHFNTSEGVRAEIVNGVLEAEPSPTVPVWMESRIPAVAQGDFYVQFSIKTPLAQMGSSDFFHFGVPATAGGPSPFQIYWQGGGRIEIRYQSGVSTYHQHVPPTPDTWYIIRMDYNSNANTVSLSIDGAQIATSDPVAGFNDEQAGFFLSFFMNAGAGHRAILLDVVETSLILPSGYKISGPALVMNGVAYDGFGTGDGMLMSPCKEGPTPLPALDQCVTGGKDIRAFLVTATDVMVEGGTIVPELKVTFYTAGDPSVPGNDQYAFIKQFFDMITGQFIGGYGIDGEVVALRAPAAGAPNDYDAVEPLIAQEQLCREVPGQPGSLRWDAARGKYLASYTPLAHNDVNYTDYVIWGRAENQDAPNLISGPDAPVWWADGTDDISAATIHADQEGWDATIYVTEDFFGNLPNGITLTSRADGAIRAKGAGNDYEWNQPALDARNITIAPVESCSRGMFKLIGETVAGESGAFATQVISFDAPGDHIIAARSTKNNFTTKWSDPVVYHLSTGTVDTSPPAIVIISAAPDVISPSNPTSIGVKDAFRFIANIADQSQVDWWFSVMDQSQTNTFWRTNGSAYDMDVAWYGKDTEGAVVQDGIYAGILTAIDNSPAEYSSEKKIYFRVDDTSPSVSIENLIDNQIVYGIVTVYITANDGLNGSGIESIVAAVDSDQINIYQAGPGYAAVWDTTAVPNGVHTISIRAIDRGGNTATQTADIIVANDVTPPIIEFLNPSEAGFFTSDPELMITVRAFDEPGGSGLKNVEWAGSGYPFYVSSTSNPEVFLLRLFGPVTQSSVVPIRIRSKDNNNNSREIDFHWIVDLDEPEITLISPATMGYLNNSMPTIVADIKDIVSGVHSDSLSVQLDGDFINGFQFNEATGRLEATVSLPLSEGLHELVIEAYDMVGNKSIKAVQLGIDTQPPVGDMNPMARPGSFEGIGEYTTDYTVYFTWDPIYDNTGGSGILTYLAEIRDGTPIDEDAGTDGQDTDEATTDGLVEYCVVAVDMALNYSAPQCDKITIAVGVPTISNVADSPDPISPKNVVSGKNTNDYTTITADVVGTDPSYTWVVQIFKDMNDMVAELPLTGPGSGTIVSAEWMGKRYPQDSYVDDGLYYYRIIATADGTGVASLPGVGTITVDNAYPEPMIVAPTDNANIKDDYYTVFIEVKEDVGIEVVVIMVDGIVRGAAQWAYDKSNGIKVYTYNWNVAAEGAGNHNLVALVADKAKNTKADDVNIKFGQIPAPEVSIISPLNNDAVKGQAPVNVHFELKEGKVKRLEFYTSADGANYTLAGSHSYPNNNRPSSGGYQFVLDTANPSNGYFDGLYYLKVVAIKSSLSAESAPVKILIDNTPPVISEVSPQNGGVLTPMTGKDSLQVLIIARLSDGGGSGLRNTASLSINGATSAVPIINFSGSMAIFNSQSLSLGKYLVTLMVSDIAGNTTQYSWVFSVGVKPEIASLCPVSGPAGSQVTLAVKGFPVDPENVKFYINYPNYSSIPASVTKYEMEIVSFASDTLVVRLPQSLPPSDPNDPNGLPFINAYFPGAYPNIPFVTKGKYFRILERPYGERMYVANTGSRNISVIDLDSGEEVATIGQDQGLITGDGKYGGLTDVLMIPDGKYVYALNGGDGLPDDKRKLNVIDTVCNTVISTIDGVSGYELLMSPEGDKLYAADLSRGVFILDAQQTASQPVSAVVGFSSFVLGMNTRFGMDGADIYTIKDAHYSIDDEALLTDPDNCVRKRIPSLFSGDITDDVFSGDLTPDGKYIVGGWGDDKGLNYYIRVFRTESGSLTNSYPLGAKKPEFLRIHPDGKYIYVLSSSNLFIIDLRKIIKNSPGDPIVSKNIPGSPSNITFSNDGGIAYVMLKSSNVRPQVSGGDLDSVLLIDHESSIRDGEIRILREITVGDRPVDIAFVPPAAPRIDSINTSQGYAGQQVVVTGINFSENADHNIVMFGSARGQVFAATSTTELTVRIPSDAKTGYLYVARAGIVSNKIPFSVLPPVIDAMYPENNLRAGQTVLIRGNGFSEIANENNVYFNDIKAELTSASFSTLTVIVPFKSISGNLHVEVGGKPSNSVPYAIIAPSISITSPANGDVFDMDADTDGNTRNGIQINVSATTDVSDGKTVLLQVADKEPVSAKVISGVVTFNTVTLYPPDTTIKVYYLDQMNGDYAEDSVSVTVSLPYESPSDIVYTKSGEPVPTLIMGQQVMLPTKQLSIYDAQTKQSVPVQNTSNGDMPSWRADGDKIVFVRSVNIWDSNDPFSPCIFCPAYLYVSVLGTGTSYPVQIQSDGGAENIEALNPSWSPDGARIAYFHDTASGFPHSSSLSVISIDENGLVTDGPRLIAANIRHMGNPSAVWSPNGKYLIFPGSVDLGEGSLALASFEEDGGEVRIKTKTTGIKANAVDWMPMSEDILGNSVLFLHLTNLPTGVSFPIYLQEEPDFIVGASVGLSGKELIYTDYAVPNRYSSYLVDLATLKRTTTGDVLLNPDWRKPRQPIYNSTPPQIKNLWPADGAFVNTKAPKISANILDDMPPYVCAVESIALTVNGIDVSNKAAYNPTTGAFSYNTSMDFEFDYLETVSYSIRATDCVGNSTDIISGAFTINDPPAISQISPPEGGAVRSQSVKISASIRDTQGIKPDSIRYEVSGIGEIPGIYNREKNTAEIQIALGEGTKLIKLKAEDIYGYKAESVWSFIVDRTSPQIKSSSPAATFNYLPSLPSEITITPIDNESGIDPYSPKTALYLIKNGINFKLPLDEQSKMSGILNYKLQATSDPYFDVETGYVLRADIYDRAGNGVSHNMTIVYDATKPQVYMQRPLNGSLVNDPFIELVIEDSISNADEMEFMKFQLLSGGTVANCVPRKVNKNTVSCDPRLPDGSQIPDGPYRLHIIVSDQAGNVLNDNSMTFTLDRSLSDDDLVNPEISEFNITPRMLNLFDDNGDNDTANIGFNLAVQSDVTVSIHALDYSMKPVYPPVRVITSLSMSPATNSIIWDGKDSNGNIVPDGAYLFRVSATDSGGTGGTYYLQDQREGPSVVGIDEEKEFSPPENNGIDFNFSFNIPSYLTISVLRDTGEIVRHVTYYEAFGTEYYHEIWDGRDSSEGIIAPGTEFRLTAVPQALPLNSVVMRGNTPSIGLPDSPVLIVGGNNETTSVEYTLSGAGCAEGCEISVRVLDKYGNEIGTLLSNELKSSGGNYSINWNGSFPFPGGNTLPDGLYTLAFDAVNKSPYSLKAKTRYLSVQIVTPVVFVRNDGFYVITPDGIEVTSAVEDSSKAIEIAPFGMDHLWKGVVPDTSPGPHTFTVELLNRSISSGVPFTVSKNYVFHAPINLMVDRDDFHPGSETIGVSFNVEYADQYSIGLYRRIPDQPVTLNDPSNLEHIIKDHEPVSGSGAQKIIWDGMMNGQRVGPGKHVLVLFLHVPGVNYAMPYYESWTLNVAD